MECPICLEPIKTDTNIGRVHGCLHEYHQNCITQWSAHSNSCPTCRKQFYGIDIVATSRILDTISIQDKILATDAIDNIPDEFVIPPPVYERSSREESETNGVCVICSSAQYSTRRNDMFSCISCGGQFHAACLGHSGEPSWFCPVCDCHQEIPVLGPNSTHGGTRNARNMGTPGNRARRPSPVPRNAPVTSRNGRLLLAGSLDPSTRASLRASIDLDGPLDDPSSSANEPIHRSEIRTRTSWNGGVLLRRQAREMQRLTPEERSSWRILENARNGNSEQGSDSVGTASGTRRKRRPRRTEGPSSHSEDQGNADSSNGPSGVSGAASGIGISSGNSRIGSLMGQIRARPGGSNIHYRGISRTTSTGNSPSLSSSQNDDRVVGASEGSGRETDARPETRPDFSQNSSPESLPSTSPMSLSRTPLLSPSPSETESPTPRPLTLEEKSMVQRHVRNRLRPLYHGDPEKIRILTEDEYIRVNKGISRQVYAHVSSMFASRGAQVVGEFFGGDQDELKRLVDLHVEGWTRDRM